MYDLCCQATLLNWTILGTENEQLTLLQLLDLYALYGHATIMNNENEERTLIKILKFLDGNLKVSWSGLIAVVS